MASIERYDYRGEGMVDEWKRMIAESPRFAIRALVVLYKYQTEDEREAMASIHRNGFGFSKYDAEFLTSLAQQVEAGRTLSAKQMACMQRTLPKYAAQLVRIGEVEDRAS